MNSVTTRLRVRVSFAVRRLLMALACLAVVTAAGLATAASAAPGGGTIIIRNDRGGSLGERGDLIRRLRATGQRVELRGTCLSACTMYLGLSNICVAPSARLGFHGPTRNGRKLSHEDFDHWSWVMARNYNAPLQSWYMEKARFRTSGYYQLSGAELIRMGYPSC